MGRKKKSESGESVPVGLRVRYEVLSVIYKNPMHPVQLPSISDFSRKLHISVPSVTRELKKLSDEGLITGRQGVGTFTNPSSFQFLRNAPGRKIIGILNNDGRSFYVGNTSWTLMSYAGMALSPDTAHPRHIELTGNTSESVFQELSSLNIDGLIWIFPPAHLFDAIRKLHECGIPVISVMQKIPGIPLIDIDRKQLGENVARHLLDMKKNKVLWCGFDPFMLEQIRCAIDYLRERNADTDDMFVAREWNEFEKTLKKQLEAGDVPEAIYAHAEAIFPILDIFKFYHVDPYQDCCQIVVKNSAKNISGFRGIIRDFPFESMAEEAGMWMKTLLNQPSALNDKESFWKVGVYPCRL